MRAGKLRHRITIQQNTPTQNSFGEMEPSWSAFATIWAAVEPLSGDERWTSDQFQSEVSHRIRIRRRVGITPLMRVSWQGRLFDIQAVLEPESNRRELHLLCSEVQGG